MSYLRRLVAFVLFLVGAPIVLAAMLFERLMRWVTPSARKYPPENELRSMWEFFFPS